jgi:hypothetical protein
MPVCLRLHPEQPFPPLNNPYRQALEQNPPQSTAVDLRPATAPPWFAAAELQVPLQLFVRDGECLPIESRLTEEGIVQSCKAKRLLARLGVQI